MNQKTKHRIGNGINYFLSSVLVISGILKLIRFEPYMKIIKGLNLNYYQYIILIGLVAVLSGILFAIPKTFIYGFIATLVFLGGTVSAHMQAGDVFISQIIFILLTVLTAYFKKQEWFIPQ